LGNKIPLYINEGVELRCKKALSYIALCEAQDLIYCIIFSIDLLQNPIGWFQYTVDSFQESFVVTEDAIAPLKYSIV
jgi:hypothetical protein